MAKCDGVVSYPPISRKECVHDKNFKSFMDIGATSSVPIFNGSGFYGHDSGVVPFTANPRSHSTQVNLKNLLNGMLEIPAGRNRAFVVTQPRPNSNSNLEFLASGINGVSSLHPSVYIPSAPPLFEVEALSS